MIQQTAQNANNNHQSLIHRGVAASLVNSTESVFKDSKKTTSRYKYALLKTVQRYLPDYRVGTCLKVPLGSHAHDFQPDRHTVQIGLTENGVARYSGMGHCGSVWQCPVCATTVGCGHSKEITLSMAQNAKAGGQSLFITFTQPHTSADSLLHLVSVQADALRKMKASRQYRELMAFYGYVGEIRGLEMTHGFVNGWHPHIHAIFLFENITVVKDIEIFTRELKALWSKFVVRAGGMLPSDIYGCDVRLPRRGDEKEVASYIAKFGMEVSLNHTKRGTGESRTPFEIMDDLNVRFDHKDYALLREYAEATKGRARIFWSRGLKDRFNIVEITDEMRANEPAKKDLASIKWAEFKALRYAGLEGYLLDQSEFWDRKLIEEFAARVELIVRCEQNRFQSEIFAEKRKRQKAIRASTERILAELGLFPHL